MMSLKLKMRNSSGFPPAVFCLSLFLQVFMLSSVPMAQDVLPKHLAGISETELEGLQFVGPFGAEGEATPEKDIFTFKDGKFVTASCSKWGFSPAPYWMRRDSKGIHFLAELESPEHGTMRYEGMFDGKELSVVAYWKKARWYWTVERTYRGKGRPTGPAK